MTMAACYANYDLSSLSQGVPQHHHVPVSMHQQSRISGAAAAVPTVAAQKDYTTPLHVDCSVEYELPNQPKPPAGQRVEPLLMIHPCYFRKMESQRRSPFVNNMPNSSRSSMNGLSAPSASAVTSSASSAPSRRTRQSQVLAAQQQAAHQHRHPQQQQVLQGQQTQHYHQQLQQQQMSQMSQQAHYPSSVASVQQHQPSSSATAQQYIEQARRAVIHSHSQTRSQHASQSQNQVQSASSWDQIAAAAASSMPATAAGIVGLPTAVNMTGQSMYSKPVGKRDAMLSGGCGVYSSATLHSSQSHSASNNTHSCISSNNLSNCAAEVALSNLRWDLPDRSPMATVPSNYQAGPESTPTIMRDDKNTLSEKYRRQYLRSHRLHPYMMTAGAVGSTFPQLAATAFPQMQQVSCYNV